MVRDHIGGVRARAQDVATKLRGRGTRDGMVLRDVLVLFRRAVRRGDPASSLPARENLRTGEETFGAILLVRALVPVVRGHCVYNFGYCCGCGVIGVHGSRTRAGNGVEHHHWEFHRHRRAFLWNYADV